MAGKIMKPLSKGVFVTATDTDVGKTFVSGLLIRSLRRKGIPAGYFKPVATGCQRQEGLLVSGDVSFINMFTSQEMDHCLHCPVRFAKPLAPLVASILEKKPIGLESVWKAFKLLKKKYPFLVVEGIGGVMVPLMEEYLVLNMMAQMDLPSLVVCRPTLGTINHTLLTLAAIKRRGIPIIGFVTNGHREEEDEAAMTSPELIARFSRSPYLGHIPHFDPQHSDPDAFIEKEAAFLNGLFG